jgi:hypothetical protein
MKFLIIIAVIVGTALLVRIVEIVIRALIGNRQKLKFILRYFPILEFLIGLALIFWAVDFLFSDKSYFFILTIVIVAVVVALIAWYVFRDVMAGVVFRVQNNLPRGASVQLGEIKGRILHSRATHVVMETDEGKTIRIPYSHATSEIISEQQERGLHEDSIIELSIPKNDSWQKTKELLNNILLNTPWRLVHSEPVVHLISEEDANFRVEIHVKTHSKKYEDNLYKFLVGKFNAISE